MNLLLNSHIKKKQLFTFSSYSIIIYTFILFDYCSFSMKILLFCSITFSYTWARVITFLQLFLTKHTEWLFFDYCFPLYPQNKNSPFSSTANVTIRLVTLLFTTLKAKGDNTLTICLWNKWGHFLKKKTANKRMLLWFFNITERLQNFFFFMDSPQRDWNITL